MSAPIDRNMLPERVAILEGNHAELVDRMMGVCDGVHPLVDFGGHSPRSWYRWRDGENGGPDYCTLRRLMISCGRTVKLPQRVGGLILESLSMGTMFGVVESESAFTESELDLTRDGVVNHHDRLLALTLGADVLVGMSVRLQQSACKRMYGETLDTVRQVREVLEIIEQQTRKEMQGRARA
jgi:hypothetical protein